MKSNLTLIAFVMFAAAIMLGTGCKKCKNEDPRARIINNGTDKVSVQIMTTGGNTVNINNIMPDSISDFAYYAPGLVQFTIAFQNNTDTSFSVTMAECWEYDIIVDETDHVSSVPLNRNED